MKDTVLKLLSGIETAYDKSLFIVKKKLNKLGPFTILPYRGFGNHTSVYISGRLLEDEGIAHPEESASMWSNMITMLKRYESDEIPNTNIQAVFQGQEKILTTDSEGYFEVSFPVKEPIAPKRIWNDIKFTLQDQITDNQGDVHATGNIMIPPSSAQFGVISDVDDTILVSRSTDLIQKGKLIFLNNAKTRKPFEGVAALYQALQKGSDEKQHNPVFYVSSSPWNLYDLLVHFCTINEIPKGPFLLRDMGLNKDKFIKSGHTSHKKEKIDRIFEAYPDLPFILIGDSGQKDAEIYEEIAHEHTDKVLAIYIRDVSKNERDTNVRKIANKLEKLNIPLLSCQHSEDAAQHAASKGWIHPKQVEKVRQDRVREEAR